VTKGGAPGRQKGRAMRVTKRGVQGGQADRAMHLTPHVDVPAISRAAMRTMSW